MAKVLDKNRISKNIKKVLSARLSEIEYQALKKRASNAGVTLSKFARSILFSGKVVQRISKADADVLRKLSGEVVGMLINHQLIVSSHRMYSSFYEKPLKSQKIDASRVFPR